MGTNNLPFSFKELYDIKLKSTFPLEIGNRKLETGEVIVEFSSIMLANFKEISSYVAARGGQNNEAHVSWDSTDAINFNFATGIFTKDQFAILNNMDFLEKEENKPILISKREIKESDGDGILSLKEKPKSNIFIYDYETGERVKDYVLEEKSITLKENFREVVVDYEYEYLNKFIIMTIGKRLIEGYVFLEAKTRVKDDVTGQVRTGIIKIPKLKLMSDLSIMLGEKANPVVGAMNAIGYPCGAKHDRSVMSITFLDEDLDEEMDN